MSSNSRRILADFFKVYLPQSSERLLIPNAFVRYCNGSLPKNAVLRNHMGSLLPVKVNFIDGGVFFMHGWQQFVRDNSIQYGEFLVFTYDGECGFSVKVFGHSGCEKRERGAYRTNKVKLEEDEEVKEKEEEMKENDNDDEGCEDNYDEDDEDHIQEDEEEEEDSTEDEDYIQEDEEEEEDSTEEEAIKKSRVRKQKDGNIGDSKTTAAVKIKGSSKRNNVVNIAEEEDEEETSIRKSRDKQQKQSGGNKGSKRNTVINIEEEEEEEEEVVITRSRDWKNRCGVSENMPFGKIGRGSERTSEVWSEEVDVSKYIQPRNPHFIAKRRAEPKRNLLLVPAKVLKNWQLELPNLMWFENERGWQCPGNVISWLDGRFWIGGWHDFCMANHVSLDDRCICEFLQGNGENKDVIKVHIVRNIGSRS